MLVIEDTNYSEYFGGRIFWFRRKNTAILCR